MEANFSCLPTEVLSHIFSFLGVHELLSAGLVCRDWLHASDLPSLLEDACVKIENSHDLSLMLTASRKFSCATFLKLEMDDVLMNLLERLSPQLLHLSLHNCSLNSSLIKAIACPRLLTLEVGGDADVLQCFNSLPSLQTLNLKCIKNLTDKSLMAFDGTVGFNLKAFYIPKRVAWSDKVIKRFYPKTNFEDNPSEYILSYKAVERFVSNRASTIKSLEFSENFAIESALRISKLKDLALRRVSFVGCPDSSHAFLPRFCLSQPGLISVDATGLVSLKDDDIVIICQILPALQQFDLSYSPLINRSIINLFQLKHLRELHLNLCCGITPASFSVAANECLSSKLRSLYLNRTQVQEIHIRQFVSHLNQLLYLDLRDCAGVSSCEIFEFVFGKNVKNGKVVKFQRLYYCQ